PDKPSRAGVTDRSLPECGALVSGDIGERMHDDIVAPAPLTGFFRDADNRIGAQIETKALARMEHRSERLKFEIEHVVCVGRRTCGEDQELARAHLAPQEVASAIRSVRKQGPDQGMGGTEPGTRLFWHQYPSKRLYWLIAAQPCAGEHR